MGPGELACETKKGRVIGAGGLALVVEVSNEMVAPVAPEPDQLPFPVAGLADVLVVQAAARLPLFC